MITVDQVELELVREAERTLLRRSLINEWHMLSPRLATALLDGRTSVAAACGLEVDDADYWLAGERWLRERRHRAA